MTVVKRAKARSTGTIVEVWDNRRRDHFDDDEPWYSICVDPLLGQG